MGNVRREPIDRKIVGAAHREDAGAPDGSDERGALPGGSAVPSRGEYELGEYKYPAWQISGVDADPAGYYAVRDGIRRSLVGRRKKS